MIGFGDKYMDLKILFEDAHVLVCYKPSGVPTQTAKLGAADMVSLLCGGGTPSGSAS